MQTITVTAEQIERLKDYFELNDISTNNAMVQMFTLVITIMVRNGEPKEDYMKVCGDIWDQFVTSVANEKFLSE